MLEFKKAFSVEEDVLPFIYEQRRELGIEDEVRPVVKIVGQEQDGTLIYVWNDPPSPDNTQEDGSDEVTYVGICDPKHKDNQRIFIHDKKVDIVHATINQDHTFLGYVILEHDLLVNAYGEKQNQEIHRAFLAEIQPQNRVFYLNLERPYYLGLQFLYGQYKGHVNNRESHLIVFLHKNSIGLYHVPVARVGNEGMIMSGEPKKVQIFHKPYVWSQWDSVSQRLHVVHFRKQGKDFNDRRIYKLYLTSYQFTSSTVNEFVLEVNLDLPIQKTRPAPNYLHLGPCSHLPDSAINIEILTQNNGTVCICCQHPIAINKTRDPEEAEDPDELITIQYSVVMVHHNKVLQRSGPKLPRHIIETARIYFTWMGDYLLAYLPGVFTHLLNVGVEYEPCNHILWEGESSRPNVGSFNPSHYVTYIQDRKMLGQGSGMCMYSIQKQVGYKLSIAPSALREIFLNSSDISMRLAILHYAVAHARDLAITKSLIKVIVEDPLHSDVSALLNEVLIGSTYTSLKRKIDRSLLRFFTSTTGEVMRGLVEKSADGSTMCSLMYRSLGHVTYGEKNPKSKWFDETYTNLAAHHHTGRSVSRFSNKDVRKELNNAASAETWAPVVESAEKTPPAQGFLKKLGAKAKSAFGSNKRSSTANPETPSRPPSRSEQLLGTLPPFFQTETTQVLQDQGKIIAKTQQLLCSHLRSQLGREPMSKLEGIAQEYTSCQLEQSRHLCHLIWSVMVPEERHIHASLSEAGSPEEYDLFLMLERYTLTLVDTAFPMTAGFQGFFTRLAFRCLEFRMFLQYLDQGVIVIDKDFAVKLLADLDDSDENVDIKFQLLSRLPRRMAIDCLRDWDHPESKRLLARDYTYACLNNDLQKTWPVLSDQKSLQGTTVSKRAADMNTDADDFFPSLSTFIHLLEQKDPHLASGSRGISPEFLTEAGLLQYHQDAVMEDRMA